MPEEDTQGKTLTQQSLDISVQPDTASHYSHISLPEGAIELKPVLVPHKKAKSTLEAENLRNAAKRNVGNFFTDLYTRLFPKNGYEIAPRMRFKLATGEEREFNPDLVQRNLLGDKLIEIKSAATKDSRFRCFLNQAENYFHHLLKELKLEANRPVVRYAFFRYGGAHDTFNLHSYDEIEASKILARNPKDAVIPSTNQALLLFMLARTEHKLHHNLDDAKQFVIPGSAVTLIHDPQSKDLGYFLDGYEEQFRHHLESQRKQGRVLPDSVQPRIDKFKSAKRFARQGFMHLDDLTVEPFPSDKHGPLIYQDVVLPQFPVMTYRIKNYDEWLKDFRKYHERILKRAGLRDLFAEEEKYRAKQREKRKNPF